MRDYSLEDKSFTIEIERNGKRYKIFTSNHPFEDLKDSKYNRPFWGKCTQRVKEIEK